MTDDEVQLAAQKMREQMEADLVKNRIEELRENPFHGDFDAAHLKAVHAYIFQDLPHHRPGITRDNAAESWIKHRALEGRAGVYDVPYASQDIDARLADILQEFGGADAIRGLRPNDAAAKLAQLYGDLDHTHGFYEGNSRTLREFTRELASEAGFELDWTGTSVGSKERNALYVARDIAVLERAYPGLTPEKAETTNERAEYEASFVLQQLRRAAGENTLDAIIRDGLSPAQHERSAAAIELDEAVRAAEDAARAAAVGRRDAVGQPAQPQTVSPEPTRNDERDAAPDRASQRPETDRAPAEQDDRAQALEQGEAEIVWEHGDDYEDDHEHDGGRER